MQFYYILHLCLCHHEAFKWGRKRHEQDFHSCAGNKVQHHLTFVGLAFGCVFTTSSTRVTTSPLSRCVAWASSENILLHQQVAGVALALRGRSNCICPCKRRRTQECKARTTCLMISLDWSLCFVCVCVCVCLSLSRTQPQSLKWLLTTTTTLFSEAPQQLSANEAKQLQTMKVSLCPNTSENNNNNKTRSSKRRKILLL